MLARNREFGRQVLEALHLEQACVAVLRLLQHRLNLGASTRSHRAFVGKT